MKRGFLRSFAGSYLPGLLKANPGPPLRRDDRECGRGRSGLGPEKPRVAEARLLEDVTERKRTEDAPRDNGERYDERFRALVQNSSDIIALLEVDGTILYQSPSVERVLGYRPDELIGKNAFAFVHPEDLERVVGAFAEVLSDPDLQPSLEYRFRHKDGSWRWLESVGTNLLENPNVGELVVNSRDVTERKLVEEWLREAEARYRTVLDAAFDGIVTITPDGVVRWFNRGAERIFGHRAEEIIGQPITLL